MHTPEELHAGLLHARPSVRWFVVDRLIARGLQHPATIPVMIRALTTDPESDVRYAVATVFWKLGSDDRVVVALRRTMAHDPDVEVRTEAMSSLDQLGAFE